MSMSDPIADMLTRIRNGLKAKKTSVVCPGSKFKKNLAELLVQEGFLARVEEQDVRPGIRDLHIHLRYHQGKPAIERVQRISTPGLRVYREVNDLPRVANGLGVAVISTPKGLMTDSQARRQNLGGEVVCSVF